MLDCHFNSLLLTLFNAVGTVEFSINACVQKGKLISSSLCIIVTIVEYVGRDFFAAQKGSTRKFTLLQSKHLRCHHNSSPCDLVTAWSKFFTGFVIFAVGVPISVFVVIR